VTSPVCDCLLRFRFLAPNLPRDQSAAPRYLYRPAPHAIFSFRVHARCFIVGCACLGFYLLDLRFLGRIPFFSSRRAPRFGEHLAALVPGPVRSIHRFLYLFPLQRMSGSPPGVFPALLLSCFPLSLCSLYSNVFSFNAASVRRSLFLGRDAFKSMRVDVLRASLGSISIVQGHAFFLYCILPLLF